VSRLILAKVWKSWEPSKVIVLSWQHSRIGFYIVKTSFSEGWLRILTIPYVCYVWTQLSQWAIYS
jgi:hypothetical protein